MTQEDRTALTELMENNEIIIKPADKGGAIVIRDKDKYITECMCQLNKRDHYKRTGTNQTAQFCERVNNYIKRWKRDGILDAHTGDYLICKDPRTAKFYTLSKILKHKTPGRPIISANECPTEKISEFLEYYLSPLAKQVTFYFKDTTHFLEICRNIHDIRESTILTTIDVSALYTSIPHEGGLQAIRTALSRRDDQNPPTEVLVELTRLILTNNVFEFDKQYYSLSNVIVADEKRPHSINI